MLHRDPWNESLAPLTECRYAKAYKALRPPRCDDGSGHPCGTCALKWLQTQQRGRRGFVNGRAFSAD